MISVSSIKKIFAEFDEKSSSVAKCLGGGKLRVLLSMIYCLARYGARPIDYERFGFFTKSHFERNRYFTFLRYFRLIKHMDVDTIHKISGKKKNELETFNAFINRDWMICSSETSKSDIIEFIKKHQRIIAKPENGEQGHGVILISKDDNEFIDQLINDAKNRDYLLEEVVGNAPYINQINPTSLNTIRAYTLIDKKGNPMILSIMLRVGAPNAVVDNWGSGGVGYVFDLTTGICFQPGVDKKNRQYVFHPGSNVKMVGFELRDFEKLKAYILQLTQVIPKARFVGWDIAITKNGFELIEMNCPGGHDFLQAFGKPFYHIIKKNW